MNFYIFQAFSFCSVKVRDQLQDVQKVVGTAGAFAAIRADGRVITWGDAEFGGDSHGVQDQLCEVQEVCATSAAFAALKAD
ncbi:RAB2A, partial [Symbiodinium sp. CCMP2456]